MKNNIYLPIFLLIFFTSLFFYTPKAEATHNSSSFAPAATYTGGAAFDIYLGPAVGDFNDDGHLDIAATDPGNDQLSVLLNNGDGTFAATVNYAAGDYPSSVILGDFNNDDEVDLASANYFSDNVSILLGNGDGTFDAAVNYAVGDGPYDTPAVADFNHDGNLDIAEANSLNDNISVLLGNGDGTFDVAVNYAVGDNPVGVVRAPDLNEDGLMDLVAQGNNGISVLINNLALPTVEFSSASGSGLESVPSPSIPVNLSIANDVDVTVDYEVTGGTATGGGTDYTLASGTLTIPQGDTTADIPLAIVDDSDVEPDETVIITLSSPLNANLGSEDVFTYTITNDDTASQPHHRSSSGGSSAGTIQNLPLNNTPSPAPTDCLSTYQFSPSTGLPCSQPSSPTICPSGDLFSAVTGLPCPPAQAGTSFTTPVATSSTCFITSTLGIGWYGPEVKCLQSILHITADGIFGPKTKAAVILFQQAHALVPDGIVGPKTRAKLFGV